MGSQSGLQMTTGDQMPVENKPRSHRVEASEPVGSPGGARSKGVQPANPKIKRDRRQRMTAPDREEIILRTATGYFAVHGLSAGTTELARRIGITQPLLYKYFSTKDALIERIYDRLLERLWDPNWEAFLDDDTIPVRRRLIDFYCDYATSVLTYEHVRLFLFSGLSRAEFNTRYYDALSRRILKRIARAMRREYGVATKSGFVSKREMERVQSLHGTIYHIAFRRWLHGDTFNGNIVDVVRCKVEDYLDGAVHAFEQDSNEGGGK
jgi:AcrR family transcriptional regulator